MIRSFLDPASPTPTPTSTPPPGGDTVALTSGVPQTGAVVAPQPGGAVLHPTQYTIQVPNGASQLRVDLSGNQNVDLFARLGQRIVISSQGQPVADHRAQSSATSESITITAASSPPLQAGTYFIAVGNVGPGAATFTVTATVSSTQPTPTPTPGPSPTIFAQLLTPVGAALDSSGNIFVSSDAVNSTLITKFAPNGTVLAQIPIGNFLSVGSIGHLDTDPATGLIWDLLPTGEVGLINPTSGQITPAFDLRQITADTSAIYDIASGRVDGFGGLINTRSANYGDIALWRRNNQLDVFVAGNSVAFPFVMRIPISSTGQPGTPRVLISSRQSAALNGNNLTRGVAVNSQGLVLTTLPLDGLPSLPVDRAVAFSADFSQGQGLPPTVLFNGQDFTSRGMTVDAAGNFYVATGQNGNSFCGIGGSGALVVIPSALNNAFCHPLNVTIANSRDVAVRPDGALAYMTVGNAVVRYGLAPVPTPTPTPSPTPSPTATPTPSPTATPTPMPTPTPLPGSRIVRVVDTTTAPGSQVSVAIELMAQGNENGVAFSLNFEPTLLSNPQAVLGSDAAGAALFSNNNQAAQGRFGLAVALSPGQTFSAGRRQVVVVTFTAAQTSVSNTALSFGDQPVARGVSDAGANALAATFSAGTVTFTTGFEADVAPRPNGDNGRVTITDFTQIGRFVAGLDQTGGGSEFQRADCAPRDARGDGRLTITDFTQAGRYTAALDPVVAAGGPAVPQSAAEVLRANVSSLLAGASWWKDDGRLSPLTTTRGVRVVDTSAAPGSQVSVAVELAAQGNENGLGFSLNYDPVLLSNPQATLGSDAAGALMFTNTSQAAQGRFGLVLALPAGQSFVAGARQVAVVRFTIAANAPAT
ncbi:MAG: pre-peptidase C-terminal domain-containing protein, partial [Pyrinomonadaceae bacterium]